MRLIIAGSRTFNDALLMKIKIASLLAKVNDGYPPDAVISGQARGADSLGEEWAKLRGIKVVHYPANWDEYGKSAGYRRNEEMAKEATHLIAFHDGESRGTQHMIDIAERVGLGVKVVLYNV